MQTANQVGFPQTSQLEMKRLQNAVVHLERSNLELEEEIRKVPDQCYKDAISVCDSQLLLIMGSMQSIHVEPSHQPRAYPNIIRPYPSCTCCAYCVEILSV
jgi:hypothetical protein